MARVLDMTVDRLLALAGQLSRAGLIVLAPGGRARRHVEHTLIWETVHQDLSPLRRVELHRRVGEALEALHASDLDPVLPALAHHFHQAAVGGDGSRALEYAERAGWRALSFFAYEDAMAQFERALGVLDLDGRPDPRRRAELLLAIADAARRAGDEPRTAAAVEEAAALARRIDSPELLGRAALSFVPTIGAGCVEPGRIALLDEALGGLPTEDSPLRARLLGRLARELYWTDAADRRAAASREAVAMARRLGDDALLGQALNLQRFALWGPDDVERSPAATAEIVQLAGRVRDPELELYGRHWRVVDLLGAGDVAAADREIEAVAACARRQRQPLFSWWTALWQAMRATLGGRFAEAETLIGDALTIGQRVDAGNAVGAMQGQMFALLVAQGRLEHLVHGHFASVARETSPLDPERHCALALVFSELGCRDAARREFELLAADDFRRIARRVGWLTNVSELAQACAFLGDAVRAARLFALLRPHAERTVVMGPGIACLGPVSHYLALLAATMRRWDDAAALFEDALERCLRLASLPLLATTQAAYGAMLFARAAHADQIRARALLEQSLDTARTLGMARVAERCSALLEPLTPAPSGVGNDARVVPASSVREGVFRRDGESWTVEYDGVATRLEGTSGLAYVAALLRTPHRQVHSLELVGGLEPAARAGGRGHEGLDMQDVATLRERLREQRDEVATAEAQNDVGRAAAALEQVERLTARIAGRLGLGDGRAPEAALANRARQRVAKAVARAMGTVAQHHAALGHHLRTSIRTGVFCSYDPDPTRPVRWMV